MQRFLFLILCSLSAFAQAGVERVLYVEGAPRWEYRYLRNYLIEQPELAVQCFLTGADADFPQESTPGTPALRSLPTTARDLFTYDLVILGDVTPEALGPLEDQLAPFVREHGGTLLCIAGATAMPRAYLDRPLQDVLPFVLDGGPTASDSFRVVPGEMGEDWPLPATQTALSSCWPVTSLRPGAQAILVHSRARTDADQPQPLLVGQQLGKGAVLFQAFGDSWRWRADEQGAFDTHYGACLQWLRQQRTQPAQRRVRLTLTDGNSIEGLLSGFDARVYVLTLSDGQQLRFGEEQLQALEFLPEPEESWEAELRERASMTHQDIVRHRYWIVARVTSQAWIMREQTKVVALGEPVVGTGVFLDVEGRDYLLTAKSLAKPQLFDLQAKGVVDYYNGLGGNYSTYVETTVECYVPLASEDGKSSAWMPVFETSNSSLVLGPVGHEDPAEYLDGQEVQIVIDLKPRRQEGVKILRNNENNWALFELNLKRAFPNTPEGRAKLKEIHGGWQPRPLPLGPKLFEFDEVLLVGVEGDKIVPYAERAQGNGPYSFDESYKPSFLGAPVIHSTGGVSALITGRDEGRQLHGIALSDVMDALD